MSEDRGVILRGISWRDLCPWLVIFRTFHLSISLPVLFLATCGVLLTPVGWRSAELLFLGKDIWQRDPAFAVMVTRQGSWPAPKDLNPPSASDLPRDVGTSRWLSSGSMIEGTYSQFVRPYWMFFSSEEMRFTKLAYLVFGAMWTLLVWSFFGGAISRIAVVRFGREEGMQMRTACRFALSRLKAYFLAPLFPFAGVLLVLIPSILVGLLMRLDFGVLLVSLIWPLVLLGGLVIAVLMLGLLAGWPLMWGAISSEEAGDEFEALHRSYSYVFQRPLHLLFYVALAALFGGLCWLLVDRFADAVIGFTHWSTSWGMAHGRWGSIHNAAQPDAPWTMLGTGASVIVWWDALVRAIAVGFTFAYFWCAAAAVYLLIRRDVDETEFDEVHVEDDQEKRTLPPLQTDPAGVPTTTPSTPPSTPPPSDIAGEASQG